MSTRNFRRIQKRVHDKSEKKWNKWKNNDLILPKDFDEKKYNQFIELMRADGLFLTLSGYKLNKENYIKGVERCIKIINDGDYQKVIDYYNQTLKIIQDKIMPK